MPQFSLKQLFIMMTLCAAAGGMFVVANQANRGGHFGLFTFFLPWYLVGAFLGAGIATPFGRTAMKVTAILGVVFQYLFIKHLQTLG